MACNEFANRLEQLEDFLNGELDAARARELGAHLDRCSICREEMNSMRFAVRLLREVVEPQGEASSFFWTRLGAKLRAEEEKSRVAEFWPAFESLARKLSLASALALLVLGAYVANLEWRNRALTSNRQAEARELFPEPARLPANPEEVLVSLATRENGR